MVCKKRILVILLSIVATIMVGLGLLGFKPVSAASVNEISFTMRDYAQIRVDGANGMRFAGNMSEADYNAINEYYDSVEFGIFIMPEYYTELGEISYATTFGDDNVFVWGSQYTEPTIKVGETTKYRILHTLTLPTKVDGGYDFYGTVHNFKEQNIALEYTACAYVKGVKGATVEYKFAADHKPISVLEVAYKNLDAETFEEGSSGYNALVNYETTYVNYYINANGQAPKASYTTNYVYGEETLKTETVELDRLIANVNITPSAPRGYVVDADKENDLAGRVYLNDITLTINVKAKEIVDLAEKSVYGNVGLLGALSEKDVQTIELPVDIGSLSSLDESVLVKINDNYSHFLPVKAYDSATKTISVDTADVATMMLNVDETMHVSKTLDVSIESNDKLYTAKIQCLTVRTKLMYISNLEEFKAKFKTEYFDNTANGGTTTDYYSFLFTGDVIYPEVTTQEFNAFVYNYTYTENGNNNYNGIIDGRGHKIENLYIQPGGLINYHFSGEFKNIALTNVKTRRDGNYWGVIVRWFGPSLIENVYVSGFSSRETLVVGYYDTIDVLTARNVVLNFDDGEGSYGAVIKEGYASQVNGWYEGCVVEDNVIIANDSANFFTNYADISFGCFSMSEDGLYFGANLVYAKN